MPAMPAAHRLKYATLALLIGVVFGAITCSNPEEPASIFGIYRLTAYNWWGAGDQPLPYVQEAGTSPADSEKFYGGSMTLYPDSTWVGVWDRAFCPNGACGPAHPDTVKGWFTDYPPGDSAGTTLLLMHFPLTMQTTSAEIHGRRLVYAGFWVFER